MKYLCANKLSSITNANHYHLQTINACFLACAKLSINLFLLHSSTKLFEEIPLVEMLAIHILHRFLFTILFCWCRGLVSTLRNGIVHCLPCVIGIDVIFAKIILLAGHNFVDQSLLSSCLLSGTLIGITFLCNHLLQQINGAIYFDAKELWKTCYWNKKLYPIIWMHAMLCI